MEKAPVTGDIAIIIVSYRTGPSLFQALDRIAAEEDVGEIILVDNGNDAETREELARRAAAEPRLVLISGQGNVGFARACNLGAARAEKPYLLLLNPDCLIAPGALGLLFGRVRDRPRPWVATLRLMGPDHAEQRGCRRNLATPGNCLSEALGLWRLPGLASWRLNRADTELPADLVPVPAISGAFMLMPRASYEALGGMDEGYFLHVEDLDFCARLAAAGGTAWFLPQARATHLKGTSAASPLAVERHKAAGFRRYFLTHFGGKKPRLLLESIWLLLAAGLLIKGALRSMRAPPR
jgi:N-acetylglucosaminyl-diphospho-decaprenol L-rhamnosyltransferase